MNIEYRKTLIAGMVAALFSSPMWVGAAEQGTQAGGQVGEHPAVAEPGGALSTPAGSDQAKEQMGGQHPALAGTRDDQLFSMSAQELTGKSVVDSAGEEIGTVQSIVSSRDKPDELHAVITPSGTPSAEGAQEGQVTISLDELRWADDKLNATAVKADLAAQQQAYVPDQYVEVQPADQPLSEFSAFEPLPATGDPSSREPGQPDSPSQPGGMNEPVQPGEPGQPLPRGEEVPSPRG